MRQGPRVVPQQRAQQIQGSSVAATVPVADTHLQRQDKSGQDKGAGQGREERTEELSHDHGGDDDDDDETLAYYHPSPSRLRITSKNRY